ncbi:MAG: helix-turn-helix domain-containing protein [Hyphomicrobiaceae bacterium]|nr:helix-turn-helix domain-containing protein [Hyphomicrobiaceae bacterium]
MNMHLSRPIPCPCCKQAVHTPPLEIVIDHYKVPALQSRILGAVWKGKGQPVPTERIFDVMYADDPDGGPAPQTMYRAFKVALFHLRQRLKGSGVSIENVGYRRGYRLVLKPNEARV